MAALDGLPPLRDVIQRHGSQLSDGRVTRVSQQVTVVGRLNPATLQQRRQHLDPCAAAQGVWWYHPKNLSYPTPFACSASKRCGFGGPIAARVRLRCAQQRSQTEGPSNCSAAALTQA